MEATAIRLEQLGLIQKGSWQFLAESKFAPREAAELLALESLPINDLPYPDRYRYLAVAAFERGEIGVSDLAHYLRCDILKARELATITLSSREIDSTGEQSAWRLDFAKSLLSPVP